MLNSEKTLFKILWTVGPWLGDVITYLHHNHIGDDVMGCAGLTTYTTAEFHSICNVCYTFITDIHENRHCFTVLRDSTAVFNLLAIHLYIRAVLQTELQYTSYSVHIVKHYVSEIINWKENKA